MAKYIVTGGGGFLGKALVKRLITLGHTVESLSRNSYKELDDLNVKSHKVDLSIFNKELVQNVFKNIDGIFHVAAKVGMGGSYPDFYNVNVVGTENLIEYCRLAKIKNFVFTSSPSVVASGENLNGVNESIDYPEKHHAPYPATKAIAERIVLRANRENFRTISLRPHLIFGPNDTSLIPTILEKAKTKKLKIIGDGENIVDFNYIDDCVEAHVQAMKALEAKKAEASGRAYFISQGEPYKFWEFVNTALKANGIEEINKKIPYSLAYFVASLAEVLSFITKKEPVLNRFLVEELATNHYFDINSARKLLNYNPKFSMYEALKLTFAN